MRTLSPVPTAQTCGKCKSRPATAGTDNQSHRPVCIACSAITSIELPPTLEKLGTVPQPIVQSPCWKIAQPMATRDALWLHQALSLDRLQLGDHIVVATPTASGKSLIFQLWTFHLLSMDPDAVSLIFYPTKALANDQLRRWQDSCRAVGLPADTVGIINGDVPMSHRDGIITKARILIMTPDVCHAWLTRLVNSQSISQFLKNLRLIIIDEAHTYESILGSNSAYLFRRLSTAAISAGNPAQPQYIAATATILDPDEHLNRLTGQIFTVVDEQDNGSPRYTRNLHHLPLNPGAGSGEVQISRLITAIIDADPDAQVIAFHDSRQGVERIVQNIGRPETVLPYRAGYLAQDRKHIENKLRDNSIRGIIATSALELGIDMPDLNYGINLDLPPTRKQFHQRMGRIGRSRPGTFVLLAPSTRFATYGETFEDYYNNSVEPSQLYVDNDYISYVQALCLKSELKATNQDTMVPPPNSDWPAGFEMSLRNAHGRPPVHLAQISQRSSTSPPHLAYSLRSSGEETLDIILHNQNGQDAKAESRIGSINVSMALKEAYPGATYRHMGNSYRAEEWARRPNNKNPFIRVTPLNDPDRRAPLIRNMVTLDHQADNIIAHHLKTSTTGLIAELKLNVTESVEGYKPDQEQVQYYHRLSTKDPRKTRKQREFPTTAIHIRIDQKWFTGDAGKPWQARQQVSNALRLHLSYNRSIALPDIKTAYENIIIETDQGAYLSNSSIVIYDNIYGGLGLVQYLYDQLPQYAQAITRGASEHPAARKVINADNAESFYQWLREVNTSVAGQPPQPTTADWWRVLTKGTHVEIFSPNLNTMSEGTVEDHVWDDAVTYLVRTEEEEIKLTDSQTTVIGTPDWLLWQPTTGHYKELVITQQEDMA